MEQSNHSGYNFMSIFALSIGIVCLCLRYFGQYLPRIPLSSFSSIPRTAKLVLHKCASYIMRFLNLSATSGNTLCIEDLPSDVLLHIFSFLPLSSLGQLVRVSKMWSDVLRDQNNIDFILDRKSPNRQNRISMYLLRRNAGRWENRSTELYILESMRNSTCCVSALEVGKLMIINTTCSGFICCSLPSTPSELFLCNPLTREFVKFPDHPKMKAEQTMFKSCTLGWVKRSPEISRFGLGIDLTCKKPSKLVGFYRNDINGSSIYECYVCTIGSNSWRSVGVTMFAPSGDAVVYNWTLYWKVGAYGSSSLAPILAFDLENEKIRLVSPPEIKGDMSWFSYIAKLGEELSYLCKYDRETRVHVLEDDVKMVWSLRYCLIDYPYISDYDVYGVWPGNALFVRHSACSGMYCYSPNDKRFHRLFVNVDGCPIQYNYVVGQYYPTLVSPTTFWS